MVTLKNENGVIKRVKVGVSFTVFFFGFFVPIFRGDWKYAAIMFVTSIVGGMVIPGVGAWVVFFIFMFKYNEWYVDDLKAKGFKVMNQHDS